MSKKLTFQSVDATRVAAAVAVSAANDHLEAMKARVEADMALASSLHDLIIVAKSMLEGGSGFNIKAEHADALRSTAHSYGLDFAPHYTRRDLVSVIHLEAA